MSWVDQVKDVFVYRLKFELHKNKGKQLGNILRKMSKESGLPYALLAVWHQENKYGSGAGLFCKRCGNHPVRIATSSGKPHGPQSQYYGLCASCVVDYRCNVTTKKEGGGKDVKKR
jgi:hypothetical protein